MRNDYQRVGFAGRRCVSDGNPGDGKVGRRSGRLRGETRRVGLAFRTFRDDRWVPKVDGQRTISFLEASIGGVEGQNVLLPSLHQGGGSDSYSRISQPCELRGIDSKLAGGPGRRGEARAERRKGDNQCR